MGTFGDWLGIGQGPSGGLFGSGGILGTGLFSGKYAGDNPFRRDDVEALMENQGMTAGQARRALRYQNGLMTAISPEDYQNINPYSGDVYQMLMSGLAGVNGQSIPNPQGLNPQAATNAFLANVPALQNVATSTINGDAARLQALEEAKRNVANISSQYAGAGPGAGRSGAAEAARAYGAAMPIMQNETQLAAQRNALAGQLLNQSYGLGADLSKTAAGLNLQDILSRRQNQTDLQQTLYGLLGGYGDQTFVAPTKESTSVSGSDWLNAIFGLAGTGIETGGKAAAAALAAGA